MSSKAFARSCRLTLDTIQIERLAIHFDVTKNLKPEPNKAEIDVKNLNPQHRKQLQDKKTIAVKLEVGYAGQFFTIFTGLVRSAMSTYDGHGDVTTKITSGDSEAGIGRGRASFQVPSSADIKDAAKKAAAAMVVGIGNIATAPGSTAGQPFGGVPTVLHGAAAQMQHDLARSAGQEWSVQDGAMQLLPIGKPVSTTAVRLAADTGMIGSPSVDGKGVMKCRSLIIPDIMPGRSLVLDAREMKGAYRIEETKFFGDTWGNDWYIEISGRKFDTA